MPSSLVFTALVVAWLAVLVPVVARRRQLVPRPAEADLCSRVLPRPGGAPAMEEVPVPARTAYPDRVDERRPADRVADDDLRDLRDTEYPEDEVDGYDDDAWGDYDDADVDDLDRDLDRDLDDDLDGDLDDHRGRPYRPGRGGFDAEAAAAAADARYAYRQRIALGLIAVAVVSALAALVVSPVLWWLHLLTDVALVGYLVFLRRQTRIEEAVRERRALRASGERRALEARRRRQAEHEDRLAAASWDGWDDEVADADDLDERHLDDLDEYDDLDDVEEAPAPRWAAPRTPAPPVPVGMELVHDSDDDPAFHELEEERVPAYRRLAGA